MIGVEIQVNEIQARMLLKVLGFKKTEQIIRQSINKVATSGRQEMTKSLSESRCD